MIFFPKLDEVVSLKDQKIEIDYNNDDLSIKGEGEIKLSKSSYGGLKSLIQLPI